MSRGVQGGDRSRLFTIKARLALLTGKLLLFLARWRGRGGTTLPGRLALKIEPTLIEILARASKGKKIVVTGTNGKTTTCALLGSIFKEAGQDVIYNQSGANLKWGIASTLLKKATLSGKMPAASVLLETDEGVFPEICREVKPEVVLITNIFRDQTDRFAEISQVQHLMNSGLSHLSEGSQLIVNADDPLLVNLKQPPRVQRLTFGLALKKDCQNEAGHGHTLKTCPQCAETLFYRATYLAHLGLYHCPKCQFKHPGADVKLLEGENEPEDLLKLKITHPKGSFELSSKLSGRYNLYNILAAATCALTLNIKESVIAEAISKAPPAFGRLEHFSYQEKEIVLALVKNAVGAGEALAMTRPQEKPYTLLVVINDRVNDGRDVSWLWDVDFEQLASAQKKPQRFVASGLRAWDVSLRFKYAGLPPELVKTIPGSKEALSRTLKDTPRGGTLFILANYTAMLEIRKELNQAGLGKPFWED